MKNIYLRPVNMRRNFFYFLLLALILALALNILPKLISSASVYLAGDNLNYNTDMLVYEKGLTNTETIEYYDSEFQFAGLSPIHEIVDSDFQYNDFVFIGFGKFVRKALLLEALKLILICLVSVMVALFIKRRILAGGIIGLMSFSILFSSFTRKGYFISRYNPFSLPSGWDLTLGLGYISWYGSLILLVASIGFSFVLALFLAKRIKPE